MSNLKRRRGAQRRYQNGVMTPVPLEESHPLAASSQLNVGSTQYRLSDSTLHLGVKHQILNVEDVQSINNHPFPFHEVDTLPAEYHDLSQFQYPESDSENMQSSRKRTRGDHPLNEWLKDRETFLSEFLRLEGTGGTPKKSECTNCQQLQDDVVYRCADCDGIDMVCRGCITSTHKRQGLHRIQIWDSDDGHFKVSSLRELGHHFQLGHSIGKKCSNPVPSRGESFLVLDLNGVHEISLDFCGCVGRQPHFIQLLRFGWFPATVGFPRTAITLRLLKFFQILSFESKASVFEFHQTLSRLSDNTGTNVPRDRYRTLLRVVREYRHIKMLKRAGRGHAKDGAQGTAPGECAVLCPACPHPGINLPAEWKNAPANMRFLYSLFLAIDANFRLKRKAVSSHATDPSLSQGWSYFVQEDDFKDFLTEFGDLIVQEPSTCSNHNAVNKNHGEQGFAASGVGCVDCARHDMKRPCSVGDLQKGERYINMDYLFSSSLQWSDLIEFIVSYDIACQWSIHLWERLKKYPHWMHVDNNGTATFRYLVPKFHLAAHIKACQTKFSFNFNANVGRTEGEGVERGWSNINPVATSTREMGPGSRRDTLDDHFGDWNWVKTTKLGPQILRSVMEAVPEMVKHSLLHEEYSESLPKEEVEAWTKALAEWEIDHSKKNPYDTEYKALSQVTVRRELADQEEREHISGTSFIMHEAISASQLITMGIELEEQQRQIGEDIKSTGPHATDDQRTKLKLRLNMLRRKIDSWIEVQHMYIPGLRVLRSRAVEDNQEEVPTHKIQLFLPSSIPSQSLCDTRLYHIEWKLRYSQCTDSLDNLREALRLKSHVLIDKSRFQRGQRANTRSQAMIMRIQRKVDTAASTYRVARDALSKTARIVEVVGWDTQLPRLRDEDIRSLDTNTEKHDKRTKKDKQQDRNRISEGRRTVSWIWTRFGNTENIGEDVRLHESLRIEWCKGKARQDRWKEEVQLLQEEKRRVLAYLEWKAACWLGKAAQQGRDWTLPGVAMDSAAVEGRIAYAREQAAQFRLMRIHCLCLWENVDEFIRLKGDGISLIPVGETTDDQDDDDYIPPIPSSTSAERI